MNTVKTYRLAWVAGDGYDVTRYAYTSTAAARTALPTVNRSRHVMGLPPATHVATYEDGRCVEVLRLAELAAA